MVLYHSNANINLATIDGLNWSTGEDDLTTTGKTMYTDMEGAEFSCKVTSLGVKTSGMFQVDVYVSSEHKVWADNLTSTTAGTTLTDSFCEHVLKQVYTTAEADGTFAILPIAYTTDSINVFSNATTGTMKVAIQNGVTDILNSTGVAGADVLVGTVYGELAIDATNDVTWYKGYSAGSMEGGSDDFAGASESVLLSLDIAKAYSNLTSGADGADTLLGQLIESSFNDTNAEKSSASDILSAHRMTVNMAVNIVSNDSLLAQYSAINLSFKGSAV